MGARRLALITLVCGLLLLVVGCGQADPDDALSMPVSMPGAPDSRAQLFSSTAIVEQVWPTVVRVNTNAASGSGVIAQTQGSTGYVITNHHVIDGAAWIQITVNDQDTYDGEVLGSDAVRDLAVVMICCGNFQKATFADVADLTPTTEVVLIGYPLDIPGAATATKGIVSAIRYDDGLQAEVIQTDAAINPGNSGGPMVSLGGEVLGINTFKITDSEGLGFAVSSDVVLRELPSLWASAALVPLVPTQVPLATPTPMQTDAPTARPGDDDLEERVERIIREMVPQQTPTSEPALGRPSAPVVTPPPSPTPTPHPCDLVERESVDVLQTIYMGYLAAETDYRHGTPLSRYLKESQFEPSLASYTLHAIRTPLLGFRDYLSQSGTSSIDLWEALQTLDSTGLLPQAGESLYDYELRLSDDPCTPARIRIFTDDELMGNVIIQRVMQRTSPFLWDHVPQRVQTGFYAFRDKNITKPLFLQFIDCGFKWCLDP